MRFHFSHSALCLAAALSLGAVGTQNQPLPQSIDAFAKKMRDVQTLQTSMRQEKEIAALEETIKTTGTLAFARPQRLCMNLTGSGGTTLIIDNDRMTTIYKALNKRETTRLSTDPRARAVAEHLFLLLQAQPEALASVYELHLLHEQPLVLQLVPRAPALAKILKNIEAELDPRGFVKRLFLQEGNGDVTRWYFEQPRINEPLTDACFQDAK